MNRLAPQKNLLLPLFFAVTMFVSAALLFLVQPMLAKMALPLLGGSPAVWNTCMVFFQAVLLAGYGYTHAVTRRLGARRQAALHLGLLLLPLLVLPIRIPPAWAPPAQQNPIPWLLTLLLMSVGLPFFMLSTIAPTLQAWYARTGHPSAQDPYFLYGASNLGSIVALLSYPILLEPRLRLAEQSVLWSRGYWLFLALASVCTFVLWRSGDAVRNTAREPSHDSRSATSPGDPESGPTITQQMRWVALAFVPSSLLLGVTTALSTEIPPIPLLWVIPLALYLLTFVLVFSKKSIVPHDVMVERMPLLLLISALPIISKTGLPVWMVIPLDLLTFFVVAMVCHGELARSRAPAKYLTTFYLCMSIGGVLGGLWNALVAPLIFRTVVEYPLALVLASLLRPSPNPREHKTEVRWADLMWPSALGLMLVALIWGSTAAGLKPGVPLHLLVFGPSLMLCLSFSRRPIRFALGLAAILLASTLYAGPYGRPLHAERSFFGVYRVTYDLERNYRLLIHGSTIQGVQSLDLARQREPLSYYSRNGPIGQVFAAFSGTETRRHVAVVGLGAGSLACYGDPVEQFTFYEIDPVVERIARDPHYFTFLRDCPPKIDVVLGDGRLSLRKAPDRHYGMIVLDAFSSDAIPMHLVTREAMQLYVSKLAEGGLLAFNVSNRYLDLRPVLGDLARDAGLVCLSQDDTSVSEAEIENGRFPSQWVVMARREGDLGKLVQDPRWMALPGRPGRRVWTDDFSNVLGIMRWGQ